MNRRTPTFLLIFFYLQSSPIQLQFIPNDPKSPPSLSLSLTPSISIEFNILFFKKIGFNFEMSARLFESLLSSLSGLWLSDVLAPPSHDSLDSLPLSLFLILSLILFCRFIPRFIPRFVLSLHPAFCSLISSLVSVSFLFRFILSFHLSCSDSEALDFTF